MDTLATVLLAIASVLSIAAAIYSWVKRKPLGYEETAVLFAVTGLLAALLVAE